MPSTIQVKVNSITPSTRGNKNGSEIAGYDVTNNKNYKTFVFELKQDGSPTVAGQVVDSMNPGDWFEAVVDDTKWKNIQSLKKIGEPAGAQVPSGGGAKSGGTGGSRKSSGGGGKSNDMTKEEWAAKDAAKELSIHRQSALKAAVNACAADGGTVTKAKVQQIEKMALRMVAFLSTGDFDGKVPEPVVAPEPTPPMPEPTPRDINPDMADDDIPF